MTGRAGLIYIRPFIPDTLTALQAAVLLAICGVAIAAVIFVTVYIVYKGDKTTVLAEAEREATKNS